MQETYPKYIFGIPKIDELFEEGINEGRMVLISGKPGSGKTTLASTMCYYNALRGNPCLFVEFVETREKFEKFVNSFGMDFRKLENEGLFTFIRLPILVSDKYARKAIEILADQVGRMKPKVLVIDSINPLLIAIKGRPSIRSIAQNFLYDASYLNQGLIILTVEDEASGSDMFSDLEYIADIVIKMKAELHERKILRVMEILKFRGRPIPMARIPFSIDPSKGIVAKPAPIIENIKPVIKKKETITIVKPVKGIIDNEIGVRLGETSLIVCPSKAFNTLYCFSFSILPCILAGKNMFIISHRLMEEELIKGINDNAEKIGLSEEIIDKTILGMKFLPPVNFTTEELLYEINNVIREYRPEVLIIHGTDTLDGVVHDVNVLSKYYINLTKMINKYGVLLILMTSKTYQDIHPFKESISSTVVELSYVSLENGIKLVPVARIYRVGNEPYTIVGQKKIKALIKGMVEATRS